MGYSPWGRKKSDSTEATELAHDEGCILHHALNELGLVDTWEPCPQGPFSSRKDSSRFVEESSVFNFLDGWLGRGC